MTRNISYLIPTSSRRHSRRFPPTLFLRLLPALLDLPVHILVHTRTHWLVDNQLVKARNLPRAVRTQEVAFEQVRLHALLAVERPAAGGLHRIPEELAVDRALQGRVGGRAFADVGLGEAFMSGYLLLP